MTFAEALLEESRPLNRSDLATLAAPVVVSVTGLLITVLIAALSGTGAASLIAALAA
jgi:hypothetical protein